MNDWDDRFNDSTSFLVYHHPKGLNLSADFEFLIAALEIGAYFRRRVVLPDTMNCANSPAYLIYNLSETMVDEPGCTYDYFAHANGLYEVYSRVKPRACTRSPSFGHGMLWVRGGAWLCTASSTKGLNLDHRKFLGSYW